MERSQRELEQDLQRLAETTAEFARAVELGDLGAAGLVLVKREIELAALQNALQTTALTGRPIELLQRVLRQGEIAQQSLVARRETARAQISELESIRRQLASWVSQRPAPAIDVSL